LSDTTPVGPGEGAVEAAQIEPARQGGERMDDCSAAAPYSGKLSDLSKPGRCSSKEVFLFVCFSVLRRTNSLLQDIRRRGMRAPNRESRRKSLPKLSWQKSRKKNLRQSASRAHGSQQLRRDSPSVESRQERRCAESARESCTPVERCRAENDAFGVAEFNRRLHDERRFVEFHHPVKDKEQRGQRGHGATGQKTRFRNAGNLALPIRRIELLRCHP
jgi:hypothetical protein